MNQEPDEYTVNKSPAGPSFDPAYPAPAQPPFRPAAPPYQPPQPGRPGPSAEDEMQARLRALRERRLQTEQGQAPPPIEYQRRGLPAPPTPQPPLKDVFKHWWEHGPFSGSLPGAADGQDESPRSSVPGALPPQRRFGRPTGPLSPSGPLSPYQRDGQEPPAASGRTGAFPRRGGPTQPLDERAKELFGQAKNWLNERARQHLQQVAAQQAASQSPALQPSQPLSPLPPLPPQPELVPEGIVPGLVVIGFAPDISREAGIQRITALGGKPLRYKASLNLFQVEVPPGQERAMIQRFWQQPEVVSASVERLRPQQ